MRQKLWRKKKFVVMAAAFACIAALSACGKKDTDYNVDVGNGDGGSVQSKYSIPESCDTTFDAGSTGLKEIRLTDSDITVPNTGAMYVAPVKMKEIDPEYRKNLVEKLFDTDKGVYVYYDMENMDKLSKEDIQEYIDLYEQQKKADPSNATNYDSDIDRMNRLLQTTSKQRENAGDYSADEYMGTVGDLEYRISFPQEGENDTLFRIKEDLLQYRPMEGATGVFTSSLEEYNTGLGDEYGELESDINECSLSVDEARQIAEEFLSKIGGSDVILQSESDLCWLYRNDGSSDQNLPTVVDGYSFEYIRSVMDQPVSDVAVWTADNLRQANGFVNVPIEKYTIQVDANGVIDALWNSYLEADGSAQAVELLSFDEMLKKANESIAAYYTKYPTAYKQIAFNDITLSYYLKQKEDGSGFEYVPAWILAEYEDPADHELPEQVVILDARDGSAIDLMKLAEAVGGISGATD